MATVRPGHAYVDELKAQYKSKTISRRQFIQNMVLLGVAVPAALTIAGCDDTKDEAQDPATNQGKIGGYVAFSMNIPSLLYPHHIQTVHGANILRLVTDALIRINSKNLPVPWLLEKWEVAEDLRSWTFYLRPNIYWSNGEELSVDHIIWNIHRWLDVRLNSSMLPLMASYMLEQSAGSATGTNNNPENQYRLWSNNAIQRINSHTFRINTKLPQISLPEHLAFYGAYILHPADGGEFKIDMIGTGPYRLIDFAPGRYAVFKRRPDFWEKPAKIDMIEISNFTDDPARSLQVLADQQIDGMQELNLNQYSTVLKMPYLKISRADSAQTGLLRMLMVHPLCQDPKLRKAMRLALDNQKLLQIGYNGLGVAAEHHHVCQTHPDYAAIAPFRANIDEAKELMRQAGYSRGFNTEILCRQNVEWEMLTTQAIAQMWKEINITVTVRPQPSVVFDQAINLNDYPFAFVAWPHRPLGIMTLNMAYRSHVPGNITQFSNIRLDEMLDKAGGILNPKDRSNHMREIELLMQDEGPICQPFWLSIYAVMNKRVQNFELHPAGYIFPETWWVNT